MVSVGCGGGERLGLALDKPRPLHSPISATSDVFFKNLDPSIPSRVNSRSRPSSYILRMNTGVMPCLAQSISSTGIPLVDRGGVPRAMEWA